MSESCSQKKKGWNAKAKRQHSPGLWAELVISVTFLVETLLLSISPGHSSLCCESSLRICNKHIIVKKLKAMISCSANTCQWNNSEHKTRAFKELTSIIKPVLQEKKLVQRGKVVKGNTVSKRLRGLCLAQAGSPLGLLWPRKSKGHPGTVIDVSFCPTLKCHDLFKATNMS